MAATTRSKGALSRTPPSTNQASAALASASSYGCTNRAERVSRNGGTPHSSANVSARTGAKAPGKLDVARAAKARSGVAAAPKSPVSPGAATKRSTWACWRSRWLAPPAPVGTSTSNPCRSVRVT